MHINRNLPCHSHTYVGSHVSKGKRSRTSKYKRSICVAPIHLVEPEDVQNLAVRLQQWTGEATLGDALHTTLSRLPNIKWLVTTLGKRGSVLLEHHPSQQSTDEAVLEDLLNSMLEEVSSSQTGNASSLGCTSKENIHIQ